MKKLFKEQADWCHRLGSPFTGALLDKLTSLIGHNAILDILLAPFPKAVFNDAVALRLTGALHALVLRERAHSLAPYYPGQDSGVASKNIDDPDFVFALIDTLATHCDWIIGFMKNAPQTNETARSIALLPGFVEAANHGPLHLLELGASAGLNQNYDKFSYATNTWTYGNPQNNHPHITTKWHGKPPKFPSQFQINSRAGCDLNPLDLTSADARLAMQSYIWPDQPARLERLRAAIHVARLAKTQIDQASADDWLASKLSGELPLGTTLIYHSIVWGYFPIEIAKRTEDIIRLAGSKATPARRLYWLRFEKDDVFPMQDSKNDGFKIDRVSWPCSEPDGAHKILATADPHVSWIKAL